MLDACFSRAAFEGATDLQSLCARLAEVLTARLRKAADAHMELEWMVADLRALGHNVKRWDQVIADWEGAPDPYLWIVIAGVSLDACDDDDDDDGAEASAPAVSVAFRPRIPSDIAFRCPVCASEMEAREIRLVVQGHGSAVAPGVRIDFECPGLLRVDDVIGAGSVQRRRGVQVCKACGAGLLLPPRH
jgi:hypothetical protein